MTILLENIDKSYHGQRVLTNLNAEIESGRTYLFLGPEGSGKSTALKIFLGIEKPDAGNVVRLGDYKYPTLQSVYVAQESRLNPRKNALENVCRMYKKASKGRALEKLMEFLPAERLKRKTADLTREEQKIVEFVGAFLMPADFIVLDDLFSGVSEDTRNRMLETILYEKGSRPLLISGRHEADFDFLKQKIKDIKYIRLFSFR